jgi:hypothetical protein
MSLTIQHLQAALPDAPIAYFRVRYSSVPENELGGCNQCSPRFRPGRNTPVELGVDITFRIHSPRRRLPETEITM